MDAANSLPTPPQGTRWAPSAGWRLSTGQALFACWLGLVLLAAVRPLALPDEGRYGEVSRWMLLSGDWLVPRLNGLPFFHKPPLLHWLQAAAMALLGPTAWAGRLVPALAAGLMLGGLYAAARRLTGERLARPAAWMLATSPACLLGGQYINHDMLVAAWIASAIWCFALAFLVAPASADAEHADTPHAGWARAGFVACALGLLTKGLIGVVLPGAVLFIWISVTRRWRQVPRLPWVSGVALFLAIAGPWFVLAAHRYPGLWAYMFGTQQFTRYTSGGFNNAQPWWFYMAGAALLLFPWPVLLLVRQRARTAGQPAPAGAADDRRTRETLWLCGIWLGTILLFFSVPRSKLVGYILPVMPPLALLCAAGWQRAVTRWPALTRWFVGLAAVPLLLSVGLTLGIGRLTAEKLNPGVAQALACQAGPHDAIYLARTGSYPYDLPFLAQTQRPLIVVQDWPQLRASAGDSWARELMDAGAFEPATAAALLPTPDALTRAATQPRRWLLTGPRAESDTHADALARMGWHATYEDPRWTLWQSAPEGPEAAQHESLPGCHQQGRHQRGP